MTTRSKSKPRPVPTAFAAALWLASAAIACFVLFSYALPQDLANAAQPYATFVQLSFFGRVLTFHFAILTAFLAILALLIRRNPLFAFTVLISLALATPTLLTLRPHDAPAATGPTLRLMSMNLKYTQTDAGLILAQIHRFNPDVLFFQDFTPYAQAALESAFGPDYPHRHLLNNGLQGLAIFSRLPFTGPRPVTSFTKIRRQMRAAILFNNQPVAIYIEHPASPRTRQRILNNRLATIDLINQLRDEKLPAIIAGDFNFTPDTPNEAALKNAGLQDSFDLAGHGCGSTWPAEPQWLACLPGFRIDHIFLTPGLTATQFSVGDYDGSDHLPIVADIALRP